MVQVQCPATSTSCSIIFKACKFFVQVLKGKCVKFSILPLCSLVMLFGLVKLMLFGLVKQGYVPWANVCLSFYL